MCNTTTLIEAIPNVSEGRRRDVIERLVDAVDTTPGAQLLDSSSDPCHDRTVLTIVGDAAGLETALLQLYSVATAAIDLTRHRGAHPRIGAVDVVPFVPLRHASVADCVSLANSLGRLVAERFSIPVFLYEDAATRPERQALENIRRGQLEGLARRMALPEWRPDFGPPTPHPTAGASAIGVRKVLIAFNVNLDTDDVEIAHQIARTVRSRNGGLAHLKAIGIRLGDHGQVQVSMNLTDYTKTPMHRVFNLVKREADKRGVSIANTEVVGLAPADALIASAVSYLRLSEFKSGQVLDARLGGWLMGPSDKTSEET